MLFLVQYFDEILILLFNQILTIFNQIKFQNKKINEIPNIFS